MYLYIAYGLRIGSEICLPELRKTNGKADIKIELGDLDLYQKSLKVDREGFWADEFGTFFLNSRAGSFLVRQGREVTVDPAIGSEEMLLRLYLIGRVFGYLLQQRGLLALHGSAIALDGGAVAFLGRSGSGKSTTAASLTAKGLPIVADDVVAVDARGGIPIVYPAYPQLKLSPDIAEFLGFDPNVLQHINPRESHRIVRLAAGYSPDPLPLRRIYILAEGESIEVQRLGQQESMVELVRNSYAHKLLKDGVDLSSHFFQCAKVAKSVPICRLVRPIDLDSLSKVACAIEDDIRHG